MARPERIIIFSHTLASSPVTQFIIDVHAHFVPKCLYERFDARAAQFPGVKLLRDAKGVRMQFPSTEPTRRVAGRLRDLADRRAWSEKTGLDQQLVGGGLAVFRYGLGPQEGLAWSRFINECMRDELRDEPRVTPLATVPLQDGTLAAQVLEE